jgi:hypothetical protein
MVDAATRATRGIGWLLLIGGVIAIVGYGGYQFLAMDTEEPIIKWGVVALYGGLGVLLLAVIRQRLIARKTDRYKDVEI